MTDLKKGIWIFAFAALIFGGVLSAEALAHGGQYGRPQPSGGTPGPKPGTPRSGGVTPGMRPNWLNWWDRNREDFFDVRQRRLDKASGNEGGQDYDKSGADHRSATKDDIRNTIIPILLKAAKDGSRDVRDSAAIALGRAGEVPVLSTLQKLLTDNDRKVRQAAILGLGLVKHPMAEHALTKVLLDPQTAFKERGMAAIALGLGGGDKAEKLLLDRLGKRSPFAKVSKVKSREVDGCRALGLGLLGRTANAAKMISAYKKSSSKDHSFSPLTLVGLGKLKDPVAAEIGVSALSSGDNDTRRGAAIMVGRCVTEKDKPLIKKIISYWKKEKDAHARYFLTISMGRIGGDQILKELRKTLVKHRNREDRAFAGIALGIAQDVDSAEKLIKILNKERDVSLRGSTAIALAIMDHKDSAPHLFKLLKKTKNPDLRSSLVMSLAMLEHREALMEIRQILAEARNERLVRACGFAMAVMYDEDSLKQMVSTLKNSGSIQVKGGMASAIGRTGDRRVIEPLVKIIKNKSETDMTRAFAIVALGLVGDKTDRSEFTRVSIDSNFAMINAQAMLEVIDIF